MLSARHFNNLSDFLGDCIYSIRQVYPRSSSKQLAKKLGIPNSTFDRISKREVEKPSFAYAVKIVREVCGDDDLQSFIKKFYPKMYEGFVKTYPGNNDVPFIDESAEKYLRNPATYQLLMLATTKNGLTYQTVLEEFGKRGLSLLQDLIDRKILIEEGGRICIKGNINAKQDTVQALLQNLVKLNYKLDRFGRQENWLSLQYESVDREFVLPRLREIYQRTNQEVRELLNDRRSKGEDLVWAGLVMDSFQQADESFTHSLRKVNI